MFGLKNYVPTWVTSTANSTIKTFGTSSQQMMQASYRASVAQEPLSNIAGDTVEIVTDAYNGFSLWGGFCQALGIYQNTTHIPAHVTTAHLVAGTVAHAPGPIGAVGSVVTSVTTPAVTFMATNPATTTAGIAGATFVAYNAGAIAETACYVGNTTYNTAHLGYEGTRGAANVLGATALRAAEVFADQGVIDNNNVSETRYQHDTVTFKTAEEQLNKDVPSVRVFNGDEFQEAENDLKKEKSTAREVFNFEIVPDTQEGRNQELSTRYSEDVTVVTAITKVTDVLAAGEELDKNILNNENKIISDVEFKVIHKPTEDVLTNVTAEYPAEPTVSMQDGFAAALDAAFARGDVFSDAMEKALGATPTQKGDELTKEFELAGTCFDLNGVVEM